MSWPLVKLHEICRPRQWKTITTSSLLDDGYPVYGANGKIGFYSEFTHEHPTLMIACRGTCGNVHISEPRSYINGNAMALDDLDGSRVDIKYLYYYLGERGFQDIISGTAQPQITGQGLTKIEIPLPPLPEQKRIADILDKAGAIRRKRQQAIQLADDFLRAVFLDMFGDPVTNPKGWVVRPVGDLCDCIVPGRDKPKSFNGSTPWITTNELIHLGVTFKKENYIGLTEDEISEVRARVVPKESVIMTCVGDLGVVSVAGEDMVINQQLHAFLPSEEIAPSYLAFSLASQKGYMLKMASSTTLPYMNKTVCNSVPVMLPPKKMQDKFESLVAKVAAFKLKSTGFSDETAFQSISQKAFSGQL